MKNMKYKNYDLYELPPIRDLKDMLMQKKKTKPDAKAFTFAKGKNVIARTYGELADDVCALGTWLMAQGYQGKHIAVIGENSYEWITVFFAAAGSGNVAVPIDRELPAGEIAGLLDKADVQTVFCSKSYREPVEEAVDIIRNNIRNDIRNDIQVLGMADIPDYIHDGAQMLEAGNCSFMDYEADRKQLCCIMFTSGTSGKSKGVMLSHENIAEDINNSCRIFRLEGNTVAVLPFHHAFGLVVATFMVLNYGYTIHINRSLKTIQRDLKEVRPQTLFVVPLFVETFHKQIWMNVRKEGKEKLLRRMMWISDLLLKAGIDVRKRLFASVREAFGGDIEYIISGGAAIDTGYVKEFRSFGIEVLNGYGTTECSPGVALNRNFYHKDGTVGVMVPGTDIRISEHGEVLLKGPIVMQGYYNDPASTGEALVDGWYHTGDLGFVDEDGFLTLTGRCKNLIILSNGENISPEELEADFRRYEEVREVLVYEQDGIITAEIYPEEEYLTGGNKGTYAQEHFDMICREVNKKRPLYKQVGKVCLRGSEFEKNTSRKILRNNRKEEAQ